MKRKLDRILTPKPHQGFLGPGHIARALIDSNFSETDPFILLMDDRIEVPEGEPVGGPHPHAGFETVTLVLEGTVGEGEDAAHAGDMQLMTAGSGVIHTESLYPGTRAHILQLWLTLPAMDRWAAPRMQVLPSAHVPAVSGNGSSIRVYSGSFAGVSSPVQNYVPLVLAEIHLESNVSMVQQLPAAYNAFLYVVNGSATVGEDGKPLVEGQVGWLDRINEDTSSQLVLNAGEKGARVILYAAVPQHDQIISHGPFIGDTREDISRLFKDYQKGKMKHINTVPEVQQITW